MRVWGERYRLNWAAIHMEAFNVSELVGLTGVSEEKAERFVKCLTEKSPDAGKLPDYLQYRESLTGAGIVRREYALHPSGQGIIVEPQSPNRTPNRKDRA